MYYIIDRDGYEFEGKTLTEVCNKADYNGNWDFSFEESLDKGEITIIKGTRIKVKIVTPKYEEVKPVVKKPVAKKPVKKGAK